MGTITIEQVVKTAQQIPSLSVLVMEVLASFDKKDVNFVDLVRKIGQDQGLTARVLRVANAPFYGNSGKIGSIKSAVVVLGFHNVRSLVAAAGLINRFPVSTTPSGFDRMAFWQHNIGTAVCAHQLAKALGKDQSLAFTTGLLHDVGKLVLDAYFGEEYMEVLLRCEAEDISMIEAERAVLGLDHTQVGHELTRRWHFPLLIQRGIRDHHNPEAEQSTLTDIVHVANLLAHMLDFDKPELNRMPALSDAAWTRLGIDLDTLPMQMEKIERQYASIKLIMHEEENGKS